MDVLQTLFSIMQSHGSHKGCANGVVASSNEFFQALEKGLTQGMATSPSNEIKNNIQEHYSLPVSFM